MSNIQNSIEKIKSISPQLKIDTAIVLGSGLGNVVNSMTNKTTIPYTILPGFPKPTVEGHGGALVLGKIGEKYIAVMQGRAHYYECCDSNIMTESLTVLKKIGAKSLILTTK
jgi:purine-nucleoside phosphorylase